MTTLSQYRDVLRFFASGVTLVTSKAGDRTHGMTVSAFTSISAEPPIIAVVIDQSTTITPLLAGEEAVFAVNILASDQAHLSHRFAFEKDEDRFEIGDWGAGVTGAPVLNDALAWLDCSVESRHQAGTHTIYLGLVQASRVARPGESPLVYWDRGYRTLTPGRSPKGLPSTPGRASS